MSALPLAHERMMSRPLPESRWGEVHVADAEELLHNIQSNTAGLVVLDPPEHLGKEKRVNGGMLNTSPVEELLAAFSPIATECARVLHEGGSTVMLGGPATSAAWEIAAEWAGLRPTSSLTVLWDTEQTKIRNSGIVSMNVFQPLATIVRRHVKPGLRLPPATRMVLPSNVLICRDIPAVERLAPVQRPVELFTYILNTMTEPKAHIVDPFCGTGSALVAATQLSRKWMGGDVDSRVCEIAARRLRRVEAGHESYTPPLYWWVAGDTRILIEG